MKNLRNSILKKKNLVLILLVSVSIFLLTPQNISGDEPYTPIGKYIWINVSPATNSTQGGIFAGACPSGELLKGFFENGTMMCAVP